MWVSKKKWNDLQERFSNLENRCKDMQYAISAVEKMTIFEQGRSIFLPYDVRRRSEIRIHSVILELCRRMGIRLEYKAGSEPSVEFVKESKK